jgi:hypothetical protein
VTIFPDLAGKMIGRLDTRDFSASDQLQLMRKASISGGNAAMQGARHLIVKR